jgi:opacity protein-like surface antigen
MNTKTITTALAIAAFGVGVTSAQAQQQPSRMEPGIDHKMYLSGNIGGVWVEDTEYSFANVRGELEYDNPGWLANVAVGYRMSPRWRGELELGHGRIDTDRITGNGSSAGINAELAVTTLTANAFFDIPVSRWGFTPYVGGGIGLAYSEVDSLRTTFGGTTVTRGGNDEIDLVAFGEAGLSFGLQSGLELVPSYRYMWIDSSEDGFDDTTAHIARIGLRYTF